MGAEVSVFRELFVEVPTALLEAAVEEARLKKALRNDLTPAKPYLRHDTLDWIIRNLAAGRGYKWQFFDVDKSARREQINVWVHLPCEHAGRIVLDELKLVRGSKQETIEYIIDTLDGIPERRCYCVQQEIQPPCTHGECK